jgi:hypothetical protein
MGYEVTKQYVQYFSPQYWLTEGGYPLRYKIPDFGVGYYFMIVIILAAFFTQFVLPLTENQLRQICLPGKSRYFWALFYMFFAAAIPSAVTVDDVPNVHRTVQMSVLAVIILVYCLKLIMERIRNRRVRLIVLTGIIILGIFESARFWNYFTTKNTNTFMMIRHNEHGRLAQWLIDNRKSYGKVYTSVERATPVYYLFLSDNFDANLAGKFSPGLKIGSLDNIVFTQGDCPSMNPEYIKLLTDNDVIVELSECKRTIKFKLTGNIHFANGDNAYNILKLAPASEISEVDK